jgi:oligoendopeptidase F
MAGTTSNNRNPIAIKKSKQGSLRAATKTPKGKNIPVAKLQDLAKNGSPAMRKKAQFALNARKWSHQ